MQEKEENEKASFIQRQYRKKIQKRKEAEKKEEIEKATLIQRRYRK